MRGYNRFDLLKYEIEYKRNGKLAYAFITADNRQHATEKAARLYKTFTGTVNLVGLND